MASNWDAVWSTTKDEEDLQVQKGVPPGQPAPPPEKKDASWYKRGVADPLTQLVTEFLTRSQFYANPEAIRPYAHSVSEFLIPQTAAGAGTELALSLLAPGVGKFAPALGRGVGGALTRIGSGALGGAAGAQSEGEDPLTGGLLGGAAPTIAPAVGLAAKATKLSKHIPFGVGERIESFLQDRTASRGRVAAEKAGGTRVRPVTPARPGGEIAEEGGRGLVDDVTRLLREHPDYVNAGELAGDPSAEAVRRFLSGPAAKASSQAREKAVGDIADATQGQTFSMKSLSRPSQVNYQNPQTGETIKLAKPGKAPRGFEPMDEPAEMGAREVFEAMQNTGARIPQSGSGGGAKRLEYGEVAREFRGQLPPEQAALFDASNKAYGQGKGLQRAANLPAKVGPSGSLYFDPASSFERLTNPTVATYLRKKMGDEQWEAFVDAARSHTKTVKDRMSAESARVAVETAAERARAEGAQSLLKNPGPLVPDSIKSLLRYGVRAGEAETGGQIHEVAR